MTVQKLCKKTYVLRDILKVDVDLDLWTLSGKQFHSLGAYEEKALSP